MNQASVTIIDTGVANTASVAAAFRRCDVTPSVTSDRKAVEASASVVLPGVGAFGAGMDRLAAAGLVDVIRDRLASGRPFLGICLGMQLLGTASQESPGVRGLGILDTTFERFPDGVTTPQFGWNLVGPTSPDSMLVPGYAYFANSFRCVDSPVGWTPAMSDHGGRFVSALERGPQLVCQFHPELSGPWGIALLQRWLMCVREEVPC